jgi:hypothetical protein
MHQDKGMMVVHLLVMVVEILAAVVVVQVQSVVMDHPQKLVVAEVLVYLHLCQEHLRITQVVEVVQVKPVQEQGAMVEVVQEQEPTRLQELQVL